MPFYFRLQLIVEQTEQSKMEGSIPDEDILLASRSSTPPLDITSQSQVILRAGMLGCSRLPAHLSITNARVKAAYHFYVMHSILPLAITSQ